MAKKTYRPKQQATRIIKLPYWRLSGFYFFYFAAVGCFSPYWNLYLKDTGFNTAQIGELYAIFMGTKIIAPNLCGWLADHTRKSMPVIRFASLLAAVVSAAFFYIHGYFWFILATAGFSFFWHAGLPQFEAVTLLHLSAEPHRYSKIRLWGSIGFIAAVLGVGYFLDYEPIGLLPIMMTSLLGLTALSSLIVPEAKHIIHNVQQTGIWQIIKKPETIAFFTVGLLLQIAHSFYYVFFSLYLKQLNYSTTLIGGLWMLGIVAEIVLFLFVKRMLARFSLRAILLFSIAVAIIRWQMTAWYSDDLALLVLAQLLHAATFGSTHVATIHLIHEYFGKQHQGKGQGLYGSLCGLGSVLGGIVGGYCWESVGATIIFSVGGLVCTLAWLITFLWLGKTHKVRKIIVK